MAPAAMVSRPEEREKLPTDRGLAPQLLGVPGELRNRIYRLVLVNHPDARIGPDNYQQPPLLRTCKKIREKAACINYSENRFGFDMSMFKSAACASWWQDGSRHVYKQCLQRRNIYLGYYACNQTGTRLELLRWARRVHKGQVPQHEAAGQEDLVYTQFVFLLKTA